MPPNQEYKYALSFVGVLLGFDLINIVLGWPWDLLGASFAGATVFLFAEATKAAPVRRTLEQKVYCVLIGIFFGSILGQITSVIIARKLDVPEANMPWVYAGMWAAVSYRVYNIFQKRLPKTVNKAMDRVDKLTESDDE